MKFKSWATQSIFLAGSLLYSNLGFGQDCTEAFRALQQNYFDALNYNRDAQTVDQIPEMEERLFDLLPCNTQLSLEEQGLPAIYTALFMKNTVQAFFHGKIDYPTLTRHRKFARTDVPRDEILARMERSVELFAEALPLRPQDRRVPGWLASARLSANYEKTGRVDSADFDQLVKTVEDYPEFNLITAYLGLARIPLDADQKQKIYDLTGPMAEFANPCNEMTSKPVDRACLNSSVAPYNLQTSLVMIGDVFLKKSDALNQEGFFKNIWQSTSNRFRATTMYNMIWLPNHAKETHQWHNGVLYSDRMSRVRRREATDWSSESALRAYQCASCHSNN